MTGEQAAFIKIFSEMCTRKSSWQVWTDFVECLATAISNTADPQNPKTPEREERYKQIMNQYTTEERLGFPRMTDELIKAMDANQEQDFLGEMFMALELGSHWKGQFFTPYSVCEMTAAITLPAAKGRISVQGWVGINDPACGAGALLIAARNALNGLGVGPGQAFFVGQDIDRTAALMCYIQLSLLGCAGYIVIADTIRYPVTGHTLLPRIQTEQDVWFMPMAMMEIWQGRARAARMDEILTRMNSDHQIRQMKQLDTEPRITVPKDCPENETGQLSLF